MVAVGHAAVAAGGVRCYLALDPKTFWSEIMSVDQSTVRRIARLARIKVSDEEVPALEGELNAILKWIEMLNDVDTGNIAPLTSVVETSMKKRNDAVTDGGYPDDVTLNAPASDDHFFVVPKVVE